MNAAASSRQPEVLRAAREQVRAVAPQRQVHVAAVAGADRPRSSGRRTPRRPCRAEHAADRLADEDEGVGRADRVLDGDRELVLPGRVLGVDLLDDDALPLERGEQVAQVVRLLDDAGVAVRRSGDRGPKSSPGSPTAHSTSKATCARQPALGKCGHGAAGDAALVLRMLGALLGEAVRRRPRPAGLLVEHDQPVEVGMQPQVADRTAREAPGHDRVVGEERVEHRRRADAPARGVFQAGQRHRLDAGDPAVVDPGGGHGDDAALAQLRGQARGPARPRRSRSAASSSTSVMPATVAPMKCLLQTLERTIVIGSERRHCDEDPTGEGDSHAWGTGHHPLDRAGPQSDGVAGRRPVRGADGAEHGGQHQPPGNGRHRRARRPAGLPARRGRRAARRLRLRPAVPVLPARRIGVRVRRADARPAHRRRLGTVAVRDVHASTASSPPRPPGYLGTAFLDETGVWDNPPTGAPVRDRRHRARRCARCSRSCRRGAVRRPC